LAVAVVTGRPLPDERALMDSLRSVHPRLRSAWLRARGFPDAARPSADSQGLRVVGRWSLGPAADVDGLVTPTETIVALARGSGVSLLRLSRSESLRVNLLSDINSDGLTYQVRIRDSLLLVSTGAGLGLYNVANVSNPVRLSTIGMVCTGFDLRDSLLYALGNNDSFRVYSIAEPATPRLLGACRDSGGSVSVAGNTAFIAEGGGLYAIDVSNPASPHRVGSYPGWAVSATARGNICCVTFGNPNEPRWLRFSVLDVSDPTNMHQIGYMDSCGGYDVYLEDSLAFISGYYTGGHEFEIVSLADSTHPTRVGSCSTLGNNFGAWANTASGAAFVADDYGGMDVINISDLARPRVDSVAFRVGMAKDLSVVEHLCYVASDMAGMKVLDVSVPSAPAWVGDIDTTYDDLVSWSVAARDSFAYMCWGTGAPLRSIDVTDPAHPRMAAGCAVTTWPEDMALRDSFLYVAEDHGFQVVNVARPRQPQVVGTCNMVAGQQWGLVLQDSFAYGSSWDGLSIVNIASPTAPVVVSQTSGTRLSTDGVAVRDTFAFIPSGYETLWVYSVANPAAPYPIAGAPLGNDNWGYDAAMYDDTLVFVGCSHSVVLVNVSDPAHPRVVGSYPAPSWVRRVLCSPPYLYACCTDAGVMILDTTAVGLQELSRVVGPQPTLRVTPNPASELVRVQFGKMLSRGALSLYDVSGRQVSAKPIGKEVNEVELNLTALSPGLYFVRIETKTGILKSKMVKR
jgi:hypothetical protein